MELFWSAFFPHFPAFGLNTDSVRMGKNVGKLRTSITPNTNPFNAVLVSTIKEYQLKLVKNIEPRFNTRNSPLFTKISKTRYYSTLLSPASYENSIFFPPLSLLIVCLFHPPFRLLSTLRVKLV